MRKPKDPKELAIAMISRSTCAVGVGAVLSDNWGIYAWSANHMGFDGMGCHAERDCLRRANRKRLADSILYVAARRRRNGRMVNARPCLDCQQLIQGVKRVVYRDGDGVWQQL